MIKQYLLLAIAALTTLFNGCESARRIPLELQYSAPSAGPVATIKGFEESSLLLDNFTSFVLSIDGKRVMTGRKGWNNPIVIRAGKRIITAEFNRGVFVSRTDIELDAAPGKNYQLKHLSDVHFTGNNTYVDFWIVDSATGNAVTAIKRGAVAGHPAPTVVPIFIPAR